ncbi:hypothetical protein D3C86_982650 [compost metagenome]
MLDDHLNLLRDVVGMQAHPLHDAFHRRTAFDGLLVVLLAIVGQLEGELVTRIVL